VTAPAQLELLQRLELVVPRADVTAKEIEAVCKKAREQKLYGVGVCSSRVALASALLEDAPIKVTALVGFPLGAADGDVKRYEAEVSIDNGAQEIEVVLNAGMLRDSDRKSVLRELRDVTEAADERTVRVAIQTHLLTREEILVACELILDSGAHFVSTGPGVSATAEQIKLLREAVGEKFGVKAAVEIREVDNAMALVQAGATRIGVSE
jgi:deoxyribose-phosphate aldolase